MEAHAARRQGSGRRYGSHFCCLSGEGLPGPQEGHCAVVEVGILVQRHMATRVSQTGDARPDRRSQIILVIRKTFFGISPGGRERESVSARPGAKTYRKAPATVTVVQCLVGHVNKDRGALV